MSSSTNVCLQCGEAFKGRANKKFCSEEHKNQYHYDNRGVTRPKSVIAPLRVATAPRDSPIPSITQRVPLREEAPEVYAYEPEDDWLARQEEEEAAEERAEQAKALHKLYSTLIVKCLKANGAEQDDDDLETWIDAFDEVSEAYRAHPALRQPPNQVHARLSDLYWLRDKFQSLQDESFKQASLWFSDEEPVYFKLSPKRLARLRENLLD